jgi:NAD+ diphosphatase
MYEASRFCGRCAAPTINDTSERARVCPKCGQKIYPRINPAVIIGVVDKENNRILLTKYRTGFAQNALVAGFTEIGETLEETVKREVMEEVGLNVTNIRYYKSQPWGIALDILAGFYCDVDGNRQIQMDESELKYAKWVAPEDIILQNPDYSLTNEMMRLFKEKGYEGTC